jgi:hypothetical protein
LVDKVTLLVWEKQEEGGLYVDGKETVKGS